jgi:WD repeat-containing protein mio
VFLISLCSTYFNSSFGGCEQTNACSTCGRGLPRCSICLMTLNIAPDPVRSASLAHARSQGEFARLSALAPFPESGNIEPPTDTINDAIVFCQTCRHGGHASHIIEWFFGDSAGEPGRGIGGERAHAVCAVADCDCHCANEL